MLKQLVKKQMAEIFRSYLYDAKKNKKRSKGAFILYFALFALLMAVTMWGYSKFTMAGQPNANDPSAASMRFMSVWMMPIMMFFICNSLSAALSYYYLLSQLIAILQTWIIRKSVNKEAILEKVRLSYSKPMPKSKWQQRLEEAQRLQEQQMRQQRRK